MFLQLMSIFFTIFILISLYFQGSYVDAYNSLRNDIQRIKEAVGIERIEIIQRIDSFKNEYDSASINKKINEKRKIEESVNELRTIKELLKIIEGLDLSFSKQDLLLFLKNVESDDIDKLIYAYNKINDNTSNSFFNEDEELYDDIVNVIKKKLSDQLDSLCDKYDLEYTQELSDKIVDTIHKIHKIGISTKRSLFIKKDKRLSVKT